MMTMTNMPTTNTTIPVFTVQGRYLKSNWQQTNCKHDYQHEVALHAESQQRYWYNNVIPMKLLKRKQSFSMCLKTIWWMHVPTRSLTPYMYIHTYVYHSYQGHCVLTSLSDGGDEDAGEEGKGDHWAAIHKEQDCKREREREREREKGKGSLTTWRCIHRIWT